MSTQKHPYWPTWSIVYFLWPAETCWWPFKCDNNLRWRLLACFMCVDDGTCNILIGSDLCSTYTGIDTEKQCGVQTVQRQLFNSIDVSMRLLTTHTHTRKSWGRCTLPSFTPPNVCVRVLIFAQWITHTDAQSQFLVAWNCLHPFWKPH